MLMNPREKFFLRTKKFLIHIILLISVIANMIPFRVPGLPQVFALIDTIAIYFFVVRNRNVFSYTFIFVLGIWYDSLVGLPLGVTALANLVATRIFLFLANRMFIIKSFMQSWAFYLGFVSFIVLEKWSLLSIYYNNTQAFNIFLIQICLSGLLFIPLFNVFDFLRVKLVYQGRIE